MSSLSLPTILETTLNNDTTIQMKTICKVTIPPIITEEPRIICIILPVQLLAEISRRVRLKRFCKFCQQSVPALVHKEQSHLCAWCLLPNQRTCKFFTRYIDLPWENMLIVSLVRMILRRKLLPFSPVNAILLLIIFLSKPTSVQIFFLENNYCILKAF